MTKKDYILIADSIIDYSYSSEGTPGNVSIPTKQSLLNLIDTFIAKLQNENDKFDALRFTTYIAERWYYNVHHEDFGKARITG